jgi:Domain of unknown function (DUF1852)
MKNILEYEIHKTPFVDTFVPDSESRLSTNLTNLSKNSATRTHNIKLFFELVNVRLNQILCNKKPCDKRYNIEINILTILTKFHNSNQKSFPISEILESSMYDNHKNEVIKGPVGFNLSSYIRDYDFYRILPLIKSGESTKGQKKSFGDLHGMMFKMMFKKNYEFGVLDSQPLTAISLSTNKSYTKINYYHKILGQEYIENGETSDTTVYFQKMGLGVRYFMPHGSFAPLAFYHVKGDLETRSNEELAMLIAVMETLQKIYRPEIYSSNKTAGDFYQPSLSNLDFVRLPIYYDRQERDFVLTAKQADYVEKEFLIPNKEKLDELVSLQNPKPRPQF